MPSIPTPETLEMLVAAGLTGEELFLSYLVFPTNPGYCNACSNYSYGRNRAVARLRGMDNSSSYSLCTRHIRSYATERITTPHHRNSEAFHDSFSHLGTCCVCSQPGYSRNYPGRQFRGINNYVHTSCADRLNRCQVCREYRMPNDNTVCCAPGTRCLSCRTRYTVDPERYANDPYAGVVTRAGGVILQDGRDSHELDWCQNCFNNEYAQCGDCGNWGASHGMFRTYHSTRSVCEGCYDRNEDYERCPRHGYLHGPNGPECCGGTPPGGIHSYSYRPRLRYRGDGPLFLGMELEVEANDRRVSARIATEAFGNLVYLKEDGSINSGFEMVTHPMTASWFVDNYNFAGLEMLAASGAHAASNCGIHVHVSKSGFSGAAHDFRWLAFMAKNEAAITTLARRSSSYARFGRTTVRDRKMIATKKTRGGFDRYSAVNVNNEHTYEVRVFASSLDPQTVAASVLFVDASVEYTRQLRASQVIRSNGWGWAAFVAWLEAAGDKYAMLRAELTRLGIGMPADPSTISTLDSLSAALPNRDEDDEDDGYSGCTCSDCRSYRGDSDDEDDDYDSDY